MPLWTSPTFQRGILAKWIPNCFHWFCPTILHLGAQLYPFCRYWAHRQQRPSKIYPCHMKLLTLLVHSVRQTPNGALRCFVCVCVCVCVCVFYKAKGLVHSPLLLWEDLPPLCSSPFLHLQTLLISMLTPSLRNSPSLTQQEEPGNISQFSAEFLLCS